MSNFISKAFSIVLRNVEAQGVAPLPQRTEQTPGQLAMAGRVNQYPQYAGPGVTMGATSLPTGLQQDSMGYGLGADPRKFLVGQDQLHPEQAGGMDSMAGIYYDSQPGTLRQEDMYLGPEGNEDLEFDLSGVYPGPYNNPFQPGSRPYNYVMGEPFEGNPFQPDSEDE